MSTIYQIVAGFEPWWLIACGLILLAAEWIIIDIGIFLTLSLTSFAMAGTIAFVANPIVVTWLFPVWLALSFLFLRPLLKLSSGQKDVYSKANYIGQIGLIKAVEATNLSNDHFFEYKKHMPLEADSEQLSGTSYRLVMKDGKELNISTSVSLQDGGQALVKTQNYDIITVEIKNE